MDPDGVRMWRPLPDDPVLAMSGRTRAYRMEPRGEYVVGTVTAASMAARRGPHRHRVEPGQLVVWDPSGAHAGAPAGAGAWSARLLVVPTEEILGLLGDLDTPPEFTAPVLDDPELVSAFHRMYFQLDVAGTRLARDEALAGWMSALLSRHGNRPAAAAPSGREVRALRLTREYLAAHATEAVDLPTLARVTGMDRFRLVRLVRERLGLPPHALLLAHRIRLARRMLEGGATPVDTASAVGFADQSHLHRHFTRSLGVTPGEYRRRVSDRG